MAKSNVANDLLKNAGAAGNLSAAAEQVIVNIPDIGEEIQNALGITADDVTASEVTLVTFLVDDSGSIQSAGNEKVVREGYNLIIDTLVQTKQKDSIIVHTKYLNGKVLYPYLPIDQAKRMDGRNYQANGGTPLYDQTVTVLASVLAKAQEFENNGVAVRTITIVITDGEDVHSHKADAKDVKKIVRDMIKKEKHIVAAMGIDDGSTPFRTIFKEMGLDDVWILLPQNTPTEIRAAFALFSQSAVRASQGAASFSKTAGGGFGNP